MDDTKLTIRPAAAFAVSAEDVRALLASGDGEAALLYLHILQSGGRFERTLAAQELHRSDRDIAAAAARLRGMGLLAEASGRRTAPLPEGHLPEYAAEDVARRSREDPAFQTLVEETQMALGHTLSSADLKKLFGIYDELALPPEVILLLVQYCKDEYAFRFGREKNLGFAFIEKEAYEWYHREILTYEQAEQWLAELQQRRSAIGQLQRELGLSDRKLSPTERTYLEDWLARGFSAEAILIAADRTVTRTNGLKWKYMDAIIQSWAERGLYTPEQIEKGDKKPAVRAGKKGDGASAPRDETKTMEQVRRLRDKIRNG